MAVAVIVAAVSGCLGETDPGPPSSVPEPGSPGGNSSEELPREAAREEPSNRSRAEDADEREDKPGSDPPGTGPESRPRTVVALVDTGINPYHEAFRRHEPVLDPRRGLEGYPAQAREIDLSLEARSYETAVERDEETWRSIEEGELVTFPGTRIVAAVSFAEPEDDASGREAPPRILDQNGHGTATASMVARAGPSLDLVALQTGTNPAATGTALDWAKDQPWIDIVSISIGNIANAPLGELLSPHAHEAPATASIRSFVDTGRPVVVGAGNQPTSSTTGEHSGPPWVITVGGGYNRSHGEAAEASKHPDVLGPYLVQAAHHRSLERRQWSAGTSFSAPVVSGTLGEALHRVRQAVDDFSGYEQGALVQARDSEGALEDGELTLAELRTGLNQSAVYWEPTDFDPTRSPTAFATPVPIAPTPWPQMGWGFVNGTRVQPLADHLLGERPLDAKPPGARDYQHAVISLRQTVWPPP